MSRTVVRSMASAIAWIMAAPLLGLYRTSLIDFLTAARMAALVPGAMGVLLRRQWYRRVLAACGEDLTVDWMGVIKTPRARIGRRVFIGSLCWIAEVDIRDNVMIAAQTRVQGGGHTHGIDRLEVPMTEQPGDLRVITLGPDAWIGTGVTVLADVAPGTVVGAGAVVTSTFPPHSVIAGVPARVQRKRGQPRTGVAGQIPQAQTTRG